jgi:hypothetical protein
MHVVAPPITVFSVSLARDLLQGVHKSARFYRSSVFTLRRGTLSLLLCSWQFPPSNNALHVGFLVLLGPPTLLSSLEATDGLSELHYLSLDRILFRRCQARHRAACFIYLFFDHSLICEHLLLFSLYLCFILLEHCPKLFSLTFIHSYTIPRYSCWKYGYSIDDADDQGCH